MRSKYPEKHTVTLVKNEDFFCEGVALASLRLVFFYNPIFFLFKKLSKYHENKHKGWNPKPDKYTRGLIHVHFLYTFAFIVKVSHGNAGLDKSFGHVGKVEQSQAE